MSYTPVHQRRCHAKAKAEGRCNACGRLNDRAPKVLCSICNVKLLNRQRRVWALNRQLVLAHYGGCCSCCGESEPDFLQIDHIDGEGGLHRRIEASARNICAWLVRFGYPLGFQILCANCNLARRWGRVCPHQRSSPKLARSSQ